jgi:hypothetical protein
VICVLSNLAVGSRHPGRDSNSSVAKQKHITRTHTVLVSMAVQGRCLSASNQSNTTGDSIHACEGLLLMQSNPGRLSLDVL